MSFEDFIKNKKVRKAEKDVSLISALVSTSINDLEFLDKLIIDKISTRKIMCNYYGVLRSVLEGIALAEGYKVYSHEAVTYLLKEKHEFVIADKFDRFRKIRNNINYYGEDISVVEVEENSEQRKKVMIELRNKYLGEFLWKEDR